MSGFVAFVKSEASRKAWRTAGRIMGWFILVMSIFRLGMIFGVWMMQVVGRAAEPVNIPTVSWASAGVWVGLVSVVIGAWCIRSNREPFTLEAGVKP